MPERNAPCPCGSGKKYKHCHGAPVPPAPTPDVFASHQALAYKGMLGRARGAFCREYTAHKQATIREVERDLAQEVARHGAAVSCRKGCGVCCSCYIIAALQECEAIVYYLYEHEEARKHFLAGYPAWLAEVRRHLAVFEEASSLQNRVMSQPTTPEEHRAAVEALDRYMELKIPCPFLHEGACAIYPVRPFVCAGVVATTPAEWCDPRSPRHGEVQICKSEVSFDRDMPYFLKLGQRVVYACAPILVYELLRRGWATLATMPGLASLEQDVARDPEVRELMGKIRSTKSETRNNDQSTNARNA